MKRLLLTYSLLCFIALPSVMADGGQCHRKTQQGQESTDQGNDTESTVDSAEAPVHTQEVKARQEQPWITNLEPSTAETSKEKTPARKEEQKKDYAYANYSFLFQLFYKYSLSDFFDTPTFQNDKKNSWQGWSIEAQEEKVVDWVNYWSKKLVHNLKQ